MATKHKIIPVRVSDETYREWATKAKSKSMPLATISKLFLAEQFKLIKVENPVPATKPSSGSSDSK